MPTALTTGITGQDGLYLSELLLAEGCTVFGLIRGQDNLMHALVEETVPGVRLLTGDLTDLSSLMRALEAAPPDEVYNLGAISFVACSWENAHTTTEVTAKGGSRQRGLHSNRTWVRIRFYQASSSEMFGKVQEEPQRESTLLWPSSPYGGGQDARSGQDRVRAARQHPAALRRSTGPTRVGVLAAGEDGSSVAVRADT